MKLLIRFIIFAQGFKQPTNSNGMSINFLLMVHGVSNHFCAIIEAIRFENVTCLHFYSVANCDSQSIPIERFPIFSFRHGLILIALTLSPHETHQFRLQKSVKFCVIFVFFRSIIFHFSIFINFVNQFPFLTQKLGKFHSILILVV